jgi:aminoglycoside N3'-acetyltransferase
MSKSITTERIIGDLRALGIQSGDTVMLRASLSKVGKLGRGAFIGALLEVVGQQGTVMSLAFTPGVPPWRLRHAEPFTKQTPSYAGALPNGLLAHPQALRSTHPQTSFVAVGPNARLLTEAHGPHDGAYEPVRRLIALGGKMALIGCVGSSPGFTTAHLAESDLNMQVRLIPPWLFNQSAYVDGNGKVQVFKPRDGGFCSASFWKFYADYVRHGVLRSGFVGHAYSVLAPAAACYGIEKDILRSNPRFNICGSPDCFVCNVQRIDRIHHAPYFLLRRLTKRWRQGPKPDAPTT